MLFQSFAWNDFRNLPQPLFYQKIVTNPGALHDLFIFGLSPDVLRVGAGKVTQGDIRIVIGRCLLAKLNGS